MPEVEQTKPQPNPAHRYSPSTDAAKKPRGRRRSGGFKTEVSATNSGNIGEINPADALPREKLSGGGGSQARAERRSGEQPARAPREPRKPRESREPREPREPRAERVTNPQPSAATLAAIAQVEAQILARRPQRANSRPSAAEPKPKRERERAPRSQAASPSRRRKPARKRSLLTTIVNFFSQFIGLEIEEPTPKPRSGRSKPASGGAQRSEGSRSRSRSGRRGGSGRRSGSRGGAPRRSSGQHKPHSAKSLSNES